MHYELIERTGSAATLHALDLPEPARPQLWSLAVTGPALVLGSTQRDTALVDHRALASAGVEVVRRRSGGGAVLLVPGEVGWLDVVLPTGAPGWAVDIHAPMHWIGAHLAAVVAELLGPGSHVTSNGAGMRPTAWSTTVCFDGLGPGEVEVDGAKLIGISQRRTRTAARLQCSWYHAHDHRDLISLLAAAHRPPLAELRPVATLAAAQSALIPHRLLARLNASSGGDLGGNGEEMGKDG